MSTPEDIFLELEVKRLGIKPIPDQSKEAEKAFLEVNRDKRSLQLAFELAKRVNYDLAKEDIERYFAKEISGDPDDDPEAPFEVVWFSSNASKHGDLEGEKQAQRALADRTASDEERRLFKRKLKISIDNSTSELFLKSFARTLGEKLGYGQDVILRAQSEVLKTKSKNPDKIMKKLYDKTQSAQLAPAQSAPARAQSAPAQPAQPAPAQPAPAPASVRKKKPPSKSAGGRQKKRGGGGQGKISFD